MQVESVREVGMAAVGCQRGEGGTAGYSSACIDSD